ncbi:MAG: class I SAM-dependent methyltransferase [Bacteroidota bacterium]
MNSEYIDLSAEKEKLMLEYPEESLEFNLLKKVKGTISKKDDMYFGNADHYLKVGLSAIQCINDSISNVENPKIINILDMPCGYGRVLRFLCQRFPNANLAAMDIVEEGVDFCTHTFGVQGIYSKKRLDLLTFGSKFDLIWCSSLITHLNAIFAVDLLNFFNRHLSVGGLLIFSSHGKFVWENIKDGKNTYGLEKGGVSQLICSYTESGYGYANYPGQVDYGISVTSTEWLRGRFNKIQGWKEIYCKEQGLDNNQDIFCIQKNC